MKQEDNGASDTLLVTGFTLGPAAFGVDARLVQEVVKVGDITPVHGAPDDIAGIRNLRGRIVTVVDMAKHLGLGSVQNASDTRVLIMEHLGESFGFLVDSVGDAIALEEENITPPPSSLDPALHGRLRGVWRDGSSLTAILDPLALFVWHEEAEKESAA